MKVVVLLVFLAQSAGADEPVLVDPDTEVSQRAFARGEELYGQGDYRAAIDAFKAGNQALPRPEFDYNIGRCYDRLGEWASALEYYRRYLAHAAPHDRNDDVRARVAQLEQRQAPPPAAAATAPVPQPRRLRIAAIVVGALAVGAAAAGGGLYGWAAADVPSRRSYCARLPRECVPDEWADLTARADGAYALWAVAGALAATDVALWIVDARRTRARAQAWFAPGGGGVMVGGRF